jgi:hypothetical protein
MRKLTPDKLIGILAGLCVIIILIGCTIKWVFWGQDIKGSSNTEYNTLKSVNDSLTLVNDALTKKIDSIQTGYNQAEFEIDFKAINAFSIERAPHDKKEVTVVGYKDKDDEVQQWYFQCSRETHKRLSEQFKREILSE